MPENPPKTLVFKILAAADWQGAVAAGCFTGSAVDLRDGFIHISAAHQVRETARRHFAGQDDLLLVAFVAEDLGLLRWEPSRGGDLFPHVHGGLDPASAVWTAALPWRNGEHVFPERFAP
ncbi:MAG TPA: DUF952 domain-containing protein [Aestuariivirga sp.]|nr:DUF952 domain-containing protein [Aestuariivirga sp.]